MEFNAPFNVTELEDALANSNNCAVARDKLHSEMLKHMPVHCLQILLLYLTEYGLQVKFHQSGLTLLLYHHCTNLINPSTCHNPADQYLLLVIYAS